MPNSLPPMVQNIDTYMASKAKSSSSSAVHGMPLDPLTEFPKFNRREIPKEGVATLKTLECQSKFLSKAKISEKQRRARMARHSNNNWFEARPHRPERLSESMIEQEVTA